MLTLNSNILKIGNKWIIPVNSGGVVPPAPTYSRYEIVFTTTVNNSQVSMNALNITPSSGTTAGGNWGTYTVTSSDITKMTDASPNAQNFFVNISSDGYGPLTLNFNSAPSGNTFTWMDCTGYWCPSGTNTATLYGIDSSNNRTQLDQISFTNTAQAQRSLSIS